MILHFAGANSTGFQTVWTWFGKVSTRLEHGFTMVDASFTHGYHTVAIRLTHGYSMFAAAN